MLVLRSIVVGVLLASCSAQLTPAATPEKPSDAAAAQHEFEEGMNLAIQGNMRAALPHLRRADGGELEAKKRQAVRLALARFDPPAPQAPPADLDPWVGKLLTAYRSYWTAVMLRGAETPSDTGALGAHLAKIAGVNVDPQGVDFEAIETRLDAELSARGYHALFGVTSPYRELLLWKTQEDKTYTVDLPGGPEHVAVAMLDGFVSLGWVGYATGDIYHTGGWTKPDRLYCLRSSYDLGSEAFRVSYLAHEGQHFADARRFPKLEQPELEYRAKLVEISQARDTQRDLLHDFSSNVSTSRDQPHPFANRRLMNDLAEALVPGQPRDGSWWERVAPEALRSAALRLIQQDTARLQRQADGS